MKIGILGLPQAGKRTLFALLTGRRVPTSRKAGESIEGVAAIRDPRVDALSRICNPRKTTYAENNFVLCPDITFGVGNRAWLEAARRCDLLCLQVRDFASAQVYHPTGAVDAGHDRADLEAELLLADMELVLNRLIRISKEKKGGQSAQQAIEEQALQHCETALEDGRRLSEIGLSTDERAAIRSLGLVTLTPILWTYNVAETDLGRDYGPDSFAVSCLIEREIAEIKDAADRADFLASLGLESSGLDRMNAAAYDAQGLMSFYTIGPDEVRAWTVRKGSRAPRAGGKIHSDIERGFIRVEIIKYAQLIATGSERAAREQGKVQLKGRDYIMEDGDTCHFLFSV